MSREPEEYDLVMLGSGFGSKFLAWTFAEQGQRVATIERKYLGGACPNIACAEQEHHSQREGRIVLSKGQGVRYLDGWFHGRYVRRARP
jgi:pyruvate/2-oxoglutarate dehydrogenase complex dihydrolipoamide dehydrogenase (E3) component